MYGSELCYIGNASLSSPFTIGDSTLRSFRDAASRLETRRFGGGFEALAPSNSFAVIETTVHAAPERPSPVAGGDARTHR